jgi:hypothetical protein
MLSPSTTRFTLFLSLSTGQIGNSVEILDFELFPLLVLIIPYSVYLLDLDRRGLN